MCSNNTGLSMWVKSQLQEKTLIKNGAAGLTDRERDVQERWVAMNK